MSYLLTVKQINIVKQADKQQKADLIISFLFTLI